MSKKLTGKQKQSARRMKAKQVASRNAQKRSFLNKEYSHTNRRKQIKEAFTVNDGKTISSEVKVIKINVKRKDDENVTVSYQPYFCEDESIHENFMSKYHSYFHEILESPRKEMMSLLQKGELNELKGLLFIGCGVSKQGIDLPLEIHGVDMIEIVGSADLHFFHVDKVPEILPDLDIDVSKEAA